MTASTLLPELILRTPDDGWNLARWEKLPADGNRYEVISGVLYMTTAPSFFHQWIIRRLFLTIYQQIDVLGLGLTIWSPIGLIMPHCDPVQPDVLVLRQDDVRTESFRDGKIHAVPALLVEVSSPSNPAYDSQIKRSAYARAGVLEYWIIRPATRDVLLCARPDATLGDYAETRLVAPDGELVSPTLPFRVAVAELFAGAPDTTL